MRIRVKNFLNSPFRKLTDPVVAVVSRRHAYDSYCAADFYEIVTCSQLMVHIIERGVYNSQKSTSIFGHGFLSEFFALSLCKENAREI